MCAIDSSAPTTDAAPVEIDVVPDEPEQLRRSHPVAEGDVMAASPWK